MFVWIALANNQKVMIMKNLTDVKPGKKVIITEIKGGFGVSSCFYQRRLCYWIWISTK